MEKITVTGGFYDVSGRPLKGRVLFSPLPDYIVHRPEESIFTGAVWAPLDEKGQISQVLVASAGWAYEVRFELKTQDNLAVPCKRSHITIPESGPLPEFISIEIRRLSTSPVLYFAEDSEGEVTAHNFRIAPDDAGAIVVPVS